MEVNFPKLEKKVLRFWKKNKIFEKSIEKRKGKKDFVFFEGPPTANAPPGLHHMLSRIFKDIIPRYKTMRGFRVIRKGGWDTHGLPVELQIEKKLGINSKKEIEKYGIAKFNKDCKKSVWNFKKHWERFTERIGFWLDLENPYITYDPKYIETCWFILKKIFEKGLLYQDFKVVPYCPRCGTPLSSHEVAQGYKKIREPAIYVKFKILNPDYKNTSLLIWTTTPWTLPANVAVAINPKLKYILLKKNEEIFILAKERQKEIGFEGEIVQEVKGKDLVGLRYQPPFDFYQPDFEKERIWEVLGADFVTLEEGTGLVHIAPAFGQEDMELIKKENEKKRKKKFPVLINVDEEGKFKMEVKKFARMFVKEADPFIIADLEKRDLLVKKEIYEHDYPFCWRCKTPLLYYAKKSWFIKMTKLKKEIIENNKKINWVPSYLKEGRFGEWLRELKDWALSRERYWGTPLPIWICQNCKNKIVIGSREDLRKQKFSKNEYFLLRHGFSRMNELSILISRLPEKISCPLTERGKKEAEKAAKKLKKEKIDLIFASDLRRTRETAEIVGKILGIKPIFDKRLRDIQAGIFEGKSEGEYANFWKDFKARFEKAPRGGESYNKVKMRIYNFVKSLEKKYSGKKILLIGHQRPFAMLEGAVQGLTVDEFLEKIEPRKMKTGEIRKIEFRIFPYNKEGKLDFHRPYVDEIEFFCPKCGSLMRRVPEVIDCWFDSGSMPFAQYHWPFEKGQKENFPPKLFPADYIAEGIDQTRGWFYTLLAVSTLLGFGPAYKNVLSLGHVLDEKGEKMSKSKGNVVDPWDILEKYGADPARWYFFTVNQPWDAKLFSEKDLLESLRKFILTFWNCYLFFETYAPKKIKISSPLRPSTLLDKWILSRINNLILEMTKDLEHFQITLAARKLEKFVIDDLSLWYIRRARKRFQKPENKKELEEASKILGFLLLTLSKLAAPFIPFLAEYVWQKITKFNFKNERKSVHLEKWPKFDRKKIDKKLEKKMEKVREIVKRALAERAKAKIKVRQPLLKLKIQDTTLKREPELLSLIKEEVNVKEIEFGKEFVLETRITPELKKEGILREIIRRVQQARKEIGLKPRQKIIVAFEGEKEIVEILREKEKEILKEAKIKKISFEKISLPLYQKKFDIEGKKVLVQIKKI